MTQTDCIFCEIIAGHRPAFEVFRDDIALAFLDTSPLFFGHTLVVPLEHHVTLGQLPPDLVGPLFQRARTMAQLMESTLEAAGSFVAMNNIVSQSVPHLHIHVVPRNRKDGLRGFFWPRTKYHDDTHAADVAAQLAQAWEQTSVGAPSSEDDTGVDTPAAPQ